MLSLFGLIRNIGCNKRACRGYTAIIDADHNLLERVHSFYGMLVNALGYYWLSK